MLEYAFEDFYYVTIGQIYKLRIKLKKANVIQKVGMQIRVINNYIVKMNETVHLPLNYSRNFYYLKIGPFLNLEESHPAIYNQILDL